MISTMGYPPPHSPSHSKPWLMASAPSPLQIQPTFLVPSRRPSIPLSPGLMPFLSFPTTSYTQAGIASDYPHQQPPIHSLPIELLCEVFSLCEAMSDNQCLGNKVIISHVCRRWRSVVLCMPTLWTYVSARNPQVATVHRVSTYLRRSTPCAVSLSLASDKNLSRHVPAETLAICSMIHREAPRIKYLQLELRGTAKALATNIAGCPFPVLSSIDIQLSGSPSASAEELSQVFNAAPSLSSVVWWGELPALMEWSHLNTIRLRGVYSLQSICDVLQQCNALRTLSIQTITDDSLPLPNIVSLPCLQTMTLVSLVSLGNLYSQLYAPALQELSICSLIPQEIPRRLKAFDDMVVKSKCKLKTLIFSDAHLRNLDIIDHLCSGSLHHVESLSIKAPPVTDAIISALASPCDSSRSPLPSLQHLHIARCRTSDGFLRDFVEPRLGQASQTLREVRVGLEGDHEQDIQFLRTLQNYGVHASYTVESSFQQR